MIRLRKVIGNKWDKILEEEFNKEYFLKLVQFVVKEYNTPNKHIYPKKSNVFRALSLTDYDDVKVVILGQDPYHGPGQANGLAFAVNPHIPLPPSEQNIYKELKDDLGIEISDNGDLSAWARQGVLLLNTVLTVEEGKAFSHSNLGWEIFTDTIIKKLNEREKPIIFVLWGSHARQKSELITNPKHCIIYSAHPSPLSAHRGFLGSKPFSKINEFLQKNNEDPIDFTIEKLNFKR